MRTNRLRGLGWLWGVVWSASLASVAGLAACASQDGPFVAVGSPERPLYEARRYCKERHQRVAEDGSTAIDWAAYESCMADLGWVKQSGSGGGAAPPMGGGGGSGY